MRFFQTQMLKKGVRPAWYSVILYLGLAAIWFVLSQEVYRSRLNYLELRIMQFCQSGLIAIIYLGRQLLFRDARNPRAFKWAAGLFLLVFLGLKFSPIILEVQGESSFNWQDLPLIFLEGLILSIFLAWFAEIIISVFQFWRQLPRFQLRVSYQYWNRLWIENVQLGLLITLFMILVYLYIANFLLVDTVLYSYFLVVSVICTGVGLFLMFFKKVWGWREEAIRTIDGQLEPYIEWSKYKRDNESNFKEMDVITWVQYLLTIREYLRHMRQIFISWWAIMAYLLFCGILLCLPYLLNVVIEV